MAMAIALNNNWDKASFEELKKMTEFFSDQKKIEKNSYEELKEMHETFIKQNPNATLDELLAFNQNALRAEKIYREKQLEQYSKEIAYNETITELQTKMAVLPEFMQKSYKKQIELLKLEKSHKERLEQIEKLHHTKQISDVEFKIAKIKEKLYNTYDKFLIKGKWFVNTAKSLKDMAVGIWQGLKNNWMTILAGFLLLLFDPNGVLLSSLVDIFIQIGSMLIDLFIKYLPKVIDSLIHFIFDVLPPILVKVAEIAIPKILSVLEVLWEKIKEGASNIANSLMDNFIEGFTGRKSARGLEEALISYGKEQGGTGMSDTWLGRLKDDWDEMMKDFSELINTIKMVFVNPIKKYIIDPFTKFIVPAFIKLGEVVSNIFGDVTGAVGRYASKGADFVMEQLQKVGDWINDVFMTALDSIGAFFKSVAIDPVRFFMPESLGGGTKGYGGKLQDLLIAREALQKKQKSGKVLSEKEQEIAAMSDKELSDAANDTKLAAAALTSAAKDIKDSLKTKTGTLNVSTMATFDLIKKRGK